LLEFYHVCRLEWNRAIEHGVQNDTSTPNVGLESFITLATENFRRDICWSTALLSLRSIRIIHKLAYTKITNFDITFGGKQNVVELDVSVEYAL